MELLERVVELSLEGYCCSQVMALLLLELLERRGIVLDNHTDCGCLLFDQVGS